MKMDYAKGFGISHFHLEQVDTKTYIVKRES